IMDDKGNGLYGPTEKGEMYPAASLTGSGCISGRTVRCISPEWMVKFHSGYKLKEKLSGRQRSLQKVWHCVARSIRSVQKFKLGSAALLIAPAPNTGPASSASRE